MLSATASPAQRAIGGGRLRLAALFLVLLAAYAVTLGIPASPGRPYSDDEAYAELLSEWVPELQVEIVPGAGHWVPYERPDEVSALIREFVAS